MAIVEFFSWKDRNKLCFCKGNVKDTNKFFYIDLNDLTVHGFSGREVKHIPTGYTWVLKGLRYYYGDNHYYVYTDTLLTKSILEFVQMFFDKYGVNENDKEMFPSLERLITALYPQGFYLSRTFAWPRFIRDIMKLLDEKKVTYGELIAELRNYRETLPAYQIAHDGSVTISIVQVADCANMACNRKKYANYSQLIDVYGYSFVTNLISELERKDLWETNKDVILEWLNHPQLIACQKMGLISNRNLNDVIVKTVKHANAMERTLEKGIPFFQWETIQRDYEKAKNEIIQKTLRESQKDEFAFEDENFIAIVPKTVQEFTDEGAAMGNCIGGMWLNGSYGNCPEQGIMARGAVFVRRKSEPDKPFVDCDFILSTGEIKQFYKKHNSDVSKADTELNKFWTALQHHLRQVLGTTD